MNRAARARTSRSRALAIALAAGLLLGGCVHLPEERCPECTVVGMGHPMVAPLPPGTRRLFVLVPGLLGYGSEFDRPVAELMHARGVAVQIFWWKPWSSLYAAAMRLRDVLALTLADAPASLEELVVVGHSVGGMVAAYAASGLPPPTRRLLVVTVASPFAGMGGQSTEANPVHSPVPLAIGASFGRWPAPTPGIGLREYITFDPPDPVMTRRFGHDPAARSADPVGASRIGLPGLGHDQALGWVIDALLRER